MIEKIYGGVELTKLKVQGFTIEIVSRTMNGNKDSYDKMERKGRKAAEIRGQTYWILSIKLLTQGDIREKTLKSLSRSH